MYNESMINLNLNPENIKITDEDLEIIENQLSFGVSS